MPVSTTQDFISDEEMLKLDKAGMTQDAPIQDVSNQNFISDEEMSKLEKSKIIPTSQIPTPPQGVLTNLPSAIGETLKKVSTPPIKFLATGAEFPERLGATLGDELHKLITHEDVSPKLKEEFAKTSALLPHGLSSFESLSDVAQSALRSAEVLTTPLFGVGKTKLAKTAIVSGLGGLAGIRKGLEEGETGTSLATPALKGALTANVANIIGGIIPALGRLGTANQELKDIAKSVSGRPIDAKTISSKIDVMIKNARKIGSKIAIKQLTDFKNAVKKWGTLSVAGATERKILLQQEAKNFYDREVVPKLRQAQKLVAHELRLETEKLAPKLGEVNKRLEVAHTIRKLANKIGGAGLKDVGGIRDFMAEIIGGGKLAIGRRLAGMAIRGLVSKPVTKAASKIPLSASQILKELMLRTGTKSEED